MNTKELAKRLQSHPDFIELTEYISDEIHKLDSVRSMGEVPVSDAGVYTSIHLRTIQKLEEIFTPFFTLTEKKKQSMDKVIAAKRRAGL